MFGLSNDAGWRCLVAEILKNVIVFALLFVARLSV